MKHGIAVWNFQEPAKSLTGLIGGFADAGFEAMSFTRSQLRDLGDAERRDIAAIMQDRDLRATIHGACEYTAHEVHALLDLFGHRLLAVTCDPPRAVGNAGSPVLDARKVCTAMGTVVRVTQGTEARVAVEDFPLDAAEAAEQGIGLRELFECPRFGILVDIGHMNLRRHLFPQFKQLSPQEYLVRIPLPIVEVHLHDNRGDRDTHEPLSFGNIDFDAVADGLRQAGFDGVATLEIAPSRHRSTPAAAMPHVKPSLGAWRAVVT